VVCLGSAILAMASFTLTRKLLKPIDISEHQTFLDAMFNIVGTLVSLILGLLVARPRSISKPGAWTSRQSPKFIVFSRLQGHPSDTGPMRTLLPAGNFR
jgi:hypothetical protein